MFLHNKTIQYDYLNIADKKSPDFYLRMIIFKLIFYILKLIGNIPGKSHIEF